MRWLAVRVLPGLADWRFGLGTRAVPSGPVIGRTLRVQGSTAAPVSPVVVPMLVLVLVWMPRPGSARAQAWERA